MPQCCDRYCGTDRLALYAAYVAASDFATIGQYCLFAPVARMELSWPCQLLALSDRRSVVLVG